MKYTIFFFLFCIPVILSAQFTISGLVRNDQTGKTLSKANIRLTNVEKQTVSSEDGTFKIINLEKGIYELNVTHLGYTDYFQSVELNGNVHLEIELVPEAFLHDEVIVSATRVSENAAATFTNFDKSSIESQNQGQDLPYILKYTPSLVTTSDAGAGVGYTGLRIRGSDQSRINVTINGVPLNDPESQGVFYVDLPDFASSVENIQIQRGLGTSTNGAGAFGGSINIKTTSLNKNPYGEINNSFGSFKTFKTTLKFGSGLIKDRFTFDGRLSRISSDGYIDRAESLLRSFYYSMGYYEKKSLLRFNIFWGHERTYQSWYGTPESRVNGDLEEMQAFIDRNYLSQSDAENLLNSGRTYNFYTYDDEVDDYFQKHYQLLFSQAIAQKWLFNAGFHFTKGKGFFEQFRNDDDFAAYNLENVIIGNDTVTSTDLIRRRWLDNIFYGATYSFEYDDKSKFKAILGGAWNQYDGNHFGEIVWAKYASNGNIRQRFYDNNGLKTDFNIFLKLNYQATSKIHLFADVQYRNVGYSVGGLDIDQRLLSLDEDLNFVNPKVGLNFRINENHSVYSFAGIGNREPSRNDYIDVVSENQPSHETLRNTELGYRFNSKIVDLAVNYYLMHYKNQLVLTGELNDVGSPVRTNVDNSYRTGIEFEGSLRIAEKLVIAANATLSANKILDFEEFQYFYDEFFNLEEIKKNNFSKTDISFSPSIIASGIISYTPIADLTIMLFNKYVGKQYLDNTSNETRSINGYFTNDLKLCYLLKKLSSMDISVTARFNNVTNRKYESNGYTFGYNYAGNEIRENFFYPQAGFHFMTGVNLRFGK